MKRLASENIEKQYVGLVAQKHAELMNACFALGIDLKDILHDIALYDSALAEGEDAA